MDVASMVISFNPFRYLVIRSLLCIDDDNSPLLYTLKNIDVLDQRAVLHDDVIRFVDLAAKPDRLIIEPHECLDRCAAPFDPKCRKRL